MTRHNLLPHLSRRQLITALASAAAWPSWAQTPTAVWSAIESRARGQTVYFNAWAGSEQINAYIQWTAEQVRRQFGVRLEHVKITETAEVVKRVRAEKAAGKTDGTVDMMWINGENFLTMKREGLLFGPFAETLPHYAYVDVVGKPTTRIDFSEPVDGMEAPWGMAQLTFFADRKRVPEPPTSMAALLAFARANPGRVTYPRPPDFHGSSFVKQAMVEALADRSALYQPVTPQALASAGPPLWAFLDALHPHLWRSGRQFPTNAAAVRQMMADGELLIALTFNPNEAANEIAAKRLPASVYSYQHSAGTIGNTHFLAIPFNSRVREGAQVVANFLLSPLAQARKADIAQWGDPTVLALDKLPAAERARFNAAPLPGQVEQTRPTILEPHGSWVDPLEKEWLRRYG
ncbi:ABC transporter substrate-binding protein [Comamonadaceae bacterium G21597-S1]|nr:ABC transporter substrate-binding protein [Comamonadaceae bacterium G21597-S1]